jgi:hypothetical protein
MKTPLLAALGLALIALAAALYLFSGTKAQEPALGGAQTATPERSATTDDTPRETVNVEPAAAAEEVQRANIATSSNEAAAGSECVVRVVDAARQPLARVVLLALDAALHLQTVSTGPDGRASLAPAGAVQLFALSDASPVQRFELELAAGERELVLDAPSASVAGVLSVGGRAPGKNVRVALRSAAAPFGELALPEELRAMLAGATLRRGESDPNGNFEFRGLSPDWSGTLIIWGEYGLARATPSSGPRRELALERPRTDLRIDLERLTRIVGRFETSSGEAVRTTEMPLVTIVSSQGRARSISQASMDEQGRFAHVLGQADFDSVDVLLECDQGRGARAAQRNELTLTPDGDFDLGVVVLTQRSNLNVRALSAGVPVAGAKARINGDLKWSEGDAEGRIAVSSAATGDATLRVIAPDFWALDVPVRLPLAYELVVELSPTNVLTINVRDNSGAPLPEAKVVFEARVAALFSESDTMNPDAAIIGVRRGQERSSGATVGESFEGELEVIADNKGVVELQGLTTKGVLSVKVVDALGQTLVSAPLAPFGTSERRELELKLPGALKSLRGRVVDPDGRSVAGAEVSAKLGSSNSAQTQTDSTGRFSLDSLSTEEFELKVESPHFAPHFRPRVALRDATTELEIRLERGRIIVVEIVDESGAPRTATRVQASTPDEAHSWYAGPQTPGRYQFRPLSAEPLKITAYVHSRAYTREIGDHEESVRFVVPTPGQLTVRLAASVEVAQRKPFVRLRSLDGAANSSQWFATDAPRGPLEFGALAPGEYELIRAYIGSTELGDAPGLHEVKPAVRFTIRAGETTQVELP